MAGGNERDASEGSGGFPAPDLSAPQLTVRAILTGMVLGALLAPCNIYAGLKIGFQFNMSIAAALISLGFWRGMSRAAGARSWGLLENNINQTATSAAASIASAGLVAPIPALALITGEQLAAPLLVLWVLSVSLVGIVVAIGLRRQMLIEDRLPFPAGVATAATIKEIYGVGREAMARVKVLLASGAAAAALKLVVSLARIPKVGLPAAAAIPIGARSATLHNLGFVLNPSLLMVGFGAIIGMRAAASLFLGAIVAWGVIGPWALVEGWAQAGKPEPTADWFKPLLEWLLWPGVTLMVTASLASFAMSWRSVAAALGGRRRRGRGGGASGGEDVSRGVFLGGLVAVLLASVAAQNLLFGIGVPTAVFAVLLTFLLAVVAARVSGETGITPIGAMGKVTQLTFGAVSPGSAATNLMAANVTGGAAGQCADLLHDMKTGLLVGASPRFQATAQLFGVLAGSFSGVLAYLVLVGDDPSRTLIQGEFPAPAVATWKAVAEVFMEGFEAMPPASLEAMVIAGAAGVLLAVLEKKLPRERARWVPSPASLGLAFVIPAHMSLSMFFGATLALLAARWNEPWARRFVVVIAAGLVAGESLAGVGDAIAGVLSR